MLSFYCRRDLYRLHLSCWLIWCKGSFFSVQTLISGIGLGYCWNTSGLSSLGNRSRSALRKWQKWNSRELCSSWQGKELRDLTSSAWQPGLSVHSMLDAGPLLSKTRGIWAITEAWGVGRFGASESVYISRRQELWMPAKARWCGTYISKHYGLPLELKWHLSCHPIPRPLLALTVTFAARWPGFQGLGDLWEHLCSLEDLVHVLSTSTDIVDLMKQFLGIQDKECWLELPTSGTCPHVCGHLQMWYSENNRLMGVKLGFLKQLLTVLDWPGRCCPFPGWVWMVCHGTPRGVLASSCESWTLCHSEVQHIKHVILFALTVCTLGHSSGTVWNEQIESPQKANCKSSLQSHEEGMPTEILFKEEDHGGKKKTTKNF